MLNLQPRQRKLFRNSKGEWEGLVCLQRSKAGASPSWDTLILPCDSFSEAVKGRNLGWPGTEQDLGHGQRWGQNVQPGPRVGDSSAQPSRGHDSVFLIIERRHMGLSSVTFTHGGDSEQGTPQYNPLRI